MGVFLVLGGLAGPAAAHPLGNATVNHYDGLLLSPDRVLDTAVEDVAEIPTFQRRARIDTDHDGRLSDAERTSYAASQCAALAAAVSVEIDGARVPMQVQRSGYVERAGQVSLTTGRLDCLLLGRADLSVPRSLRFNDSWDGAGIGWHEVVVTGDGVSLADSPFPSSSVSQELRRYPGGLLSSPLDVRGGQVRVRPGGGSSTYRIAKALPVAGPAVRALDVLARSFNNTVGHKNLTVGVGLLGLLLSLLLGAGHAFLPGHGKTIMAAYLVGRRGRLRDVVTVGATVTITHTAGVLVLGLLLTTTSAFAPTQAEQWLGVTSGLIVACVGVLLLVTAVRGGPTPRLSQALVDAEPALIVSGSPTHKAHHYSHDHDHDHAHDHHHDHHHEYEHDQHGRFGRRHSHGPAGAGFSRGGLVGLGVAGGLVPSPSALLVLLAATALGRTAFGVLLVLGYGVGMALALCAAGLLLVRLRGRLDRLARGTRLARAERLLALLPVLTALLVIAVGAGLALRAVGGSV